MMGREHRLLSHAVRITRQRGQPVTDRNKQLFKAWFLYAADAPVTWPPVLPRHPRNFGSHVTASTVWATTRTNENMRRRQLEPSQSFTAGMPAKLN